MTSLKYIPGNRPGIPEILGDAAAPDKAVAHGFRENEATMYAARG
jgi:hypothetical protein